MNTFITYISTCTHCLLRENRAYIIASKANYNYISFQTTPYALLTLWEINLLATTFLKSILLLFCFEN